MSDDETISFDPAETMVVLGRDGRARLLAVGPGPPPRVEGLGIGLARMTRPPPHRGEMHPDGDELLVLLSGRITVVLEDSDPPRRVRLDPGRGLIVPQGVWHRVLVEEPCELLHVTPGPGSRHRPPGRPGREDG